MILFISDLHLSPRTPGAISLFRTFLNGPAKTAKALFILGDFFEAWVGDDDMETPPHPDILAALHQATSEGLAIYVMHGNRDFLLGPSFAERSGCQLIDDPYILSTPEWQFVLSHGDSLCTDDTTYQTFRTQVRQKAWQQAFLSRPLTERHALATHMRQTSEQTQSEKENPYTDLNPGETDDFLRQHGYATFIHGHTHQPAKHDHIVDGIHVERWVLADWHETQAEYLAWDGEILTRHAILPPPL